MSDAPDRKDHKPFRFPSGTLEQRSQPTYDQDSPHVHITPIAAGCGAAFGAIAVYIAIIALIMSALGLGHVHDKWHQFPALMLLGIVVGMAVNVLAGYVAARVAQRAKRRHALIVGILFMALASAGFSDGDGLTVLAAALQFALAIPLAYWGATVAISRETP